jgi:hypothetical protein
MFFNDGYKPTLRFHTMVFQSLDSHLSFSKMCWKTLFKAEIQKCQGLLNHVDSITILTTKVKMAKPNKTTHPFLFSKGKICEVTGAMMTTKDSLYTNNQTLRPGPEIWVILKVDHLLFLRKCEILIQVKKLYQKLTENRNFKSTEEPVSLPEMFDKVKKGSQKYKTILQSNSEFTFAPKNTIEKTGKRNLLQESL